MTKCTVDWFYIVPAKLACDHILWCLLSTRRMVSYTPIVLWLRGDAYFFWSKVEVEAKCISDGSGARNSGFGFWKLHMEYVTNGFWMWHCSEKRGLCSMKSSNETLQNLLYFINKKTQSCFFRFSFCVTLFFP